MHVSAEISLIIFTLLCQLAVGILLAGQFAMAGQAGRIVRERMEKQSLAALVFVIIAAVLSCAHLGTPTHASYTIFNLGSSWLSREIVMVILTVGAMGCLVYLLRKQPGSKWLKPAALGSCLIGLLLIYAMSMVYASPFLPGWDSSATFFLFLASALILGSFWQGCALATNRSLVDDGTATRVLWKLFFVAMAGFILIAAFMPQAMPEPVAGLNPWSRDYSPERIANMQLLHAILCGTGILLFFGALRRSLQERPISAFLMPGLILVLAGEIVGRIAFYMSYSRLGM